MKSKGGRPYAKIDWEKLNMALTLGATMDIVCGFMDLSHDTIERHIRREHGCTFSEYRDRKMSTIRLKLIQKAQGLAFGGNVTMLIFCLKNLCGWSDKVEHGFDKDKRAILLKYSLDEKDEPKEE